jgi:hypothetical protein
LGGTDLLDDSATLFHDRSPAIDQDLVARQMEGVTPGIVVVFLLWGPVEGVAVHFHEHIAFDFGIDTVVPVNRYNFCGDDLDAICRE